MHHLSFLILAVALAAPKHESPFACNLRALTIAERARHFVQLGPMLRSMKSGVRELKNGYEFRFPSDSKTIALLAEWIAQEHLCCPFFEIELRLEPEGGPAWMRLTGREGTKQFIEADAAAWLK
jgi:hypothetical protein